VIGVEVVTEHLRDLLDRNARSTVTRGRREPPVGWPRRRASTGSTRTEHGRTSRLEYRAVCDLLSAIGRTGTSAQDDALRGPRMDTRDTFAVHHLGGSSAEVPALQSVLSFVTGRQVRVVPRGDEADLTIAHIVSLRMRPSGAVLRRASRRVSHPRRSRYSLRRHLSLLGAAERVLIVSKENLQHYAWRQIGSQVLDSDIPRLTFFPRLFDPSGERFPYWWNFVDWPDYRNPGMAHATYGRLYNLSRLMSPLQRPSESERLERACAFLTRFEFPRQQIVEAIRRHLPVDIFGHAGAERVPDKIAVMNEYRYAVASENSVEFGYETEKVPEAWDSGCIPIGAWSQPMTSDFNPAVLGLTRGSERVHDEPLLLSEPDFSGVETYLDALVR
jgi:hypothetical protein